MNSIDKEIVEVMLKEYEGENKKFPMFRDLREAESVIREEVEELEDEVRRIRIKTEDIWIMVKNDCNYGVEESIERSYEDAKRLAEEAIQVYAMWYKLKNSMEEWQK